MADFNLSELIQTHRKFSENKKLSPSTRKDSKLIADLAEELVKWKEEYENLCQFANDFEEQIEELKKRGFQLEQTVRHSVFC